MTSNIGTANMYVIQTDIDYPTNGKKKSSGNASQMMMGPGIMGNAVVESYLKQENEQMRDQVKDLETNLNINKEIIKNLLEN
jgi:hypothetical protein